MIKTWRLDGGHQTLVLASRDGHLAELVYWGASLPGGDDLAMIAAVGMADVTGGMVDETPPLSVCPQPGNSFPGHPGLALRSNAGTPIIPRFRFAHDTVADHKISLSFQDNKNALVLCVHFEMNPETGIVTAETTLDCEHPIYVSWLAAPVMPAPSHAQDMIDFSGRWCGEFQINRINWMPGARMRENRTGRTGHEHFPGLVIPADGASNTRGPVWAFHFGWSGGHKMIAEELPDGRRQVQFGIATDIQAMPNTRFRSQPLYLSYSDQGMNGCAAAFQRHLRDHIITWPRPDTLRPVHYNCWEAVYFDHRLNDLQDIATRAADLGAERFVLDDGWFGTRDDDTQSLADWWVDPRKYPDGLGPLIDHVKSLGMGFGIWFEPEMINPNSDTYRAHPDWVLGDTDQIMGRQQMVLNMALPAVQDYLFGCVDSILAEYDIDYIKWDHNRVLPFADAAQTHGTYALIDRLRAAHPGVEIESCASGGGRIDFGILQRTHRVWLSDSNDAIERLRIQHNAALFLPLAVTGSHVGPRRCHTSGRVLNMCLRAWVAAQRHMGFEMDPRELTDDESATLKQVTTWWKANRDWMYHADILRLDSADCTVIAEQQLCQTGDRFVVFAGKADTSAQILPRPLRLTQLDPQARYDLTLINREDAPALSRGAPLLKSQSVVLSGAYLMQYGLTLPWDFPETIWVIEGKRI
jgi:alpha-galactosidase